MAKKVKLTRKEIKQEDEFITFMRKVPETLSDYSQYILYALVGVAVAALVYFGVNFYSTWSHKKASDALSVAEKVFTSPVIPEEQLKQRPEIKKMYPEISSTDKERFEKSLEKFKLVSERYPRTTQGKLSIYYIGICLSHLGRYQESVAAFQAFIAKTNDAHPFYTAALVALGYAQESAGKADDALQTYKNATAIDKVAPDQQAAYLNLARLQEAKKDYKAATESLSAALKLMGDDEEKPNLERRIETLKRMAGS